MSIASIVRYCITQLLTLHAGLFVHTDVFILIRTLYVYSGNRLTHKYDQIFAPDRIAIDAAIEINERVAIS